jgi:inositol 1,4,5-triphosphate receptor type 1
MLSCYSAETAELDLDDQGGKMFLRVLLNLVMHNYPALVSGALQLLFRHFSQRREVLQAFKQVKLLCGVIILIEYDL